MSTDDNESRGARLRGFLPVNEGERNPMATHGQGALSTLLKSRSLSSSSLRPIRRTTSFRAGIESADDEELGRRTSGEEDFDDFRRSAVLMGPQMRSQRLIGNSNPRYRWDRYWKTEEQLKGMKGPMQVPSRF